MFICASQVVNLPTVFLPLIKKQLTISFVLITIFALPRNLLSPLYSIAKNNATISRKTIGVTSAPTYSQGCIIS